MTNLTVTKEKAVELKLAGWGKECYFKVYQISYNEPKINHYDITWDSYIIAQAPTITELSSEMDNNWVVAYSRKTDGSIVDLFRSPDSLADVWIWAKQENLLGRDKER